MYLVWIIRTNAGGWLSKMGNLTSDWKQARTFSLEDALASCRLRPTSAFPVALSHIQELQK